MTLNVLHFLEAGGGGVVTALGNWIRDTPSINHIVYVRPRKGYFDFARLSYPNCTIIVWQSGVFRTILKLRRICSEYSIDILHLHSSISGLARIFPTRATIIYSPHCFYFENVRILKLFRSFAYVAEKLLSINTDGYVLVSMREQLLCEKLNADVPRTVINHSIPYWEPLRPEMKVVGVGRIEKQKNPEMFAEISAACRRLNIDLQFEWVGDGRKNLVQILMDSGVKVLGWKNQEETRSSIQNAVCLLHTAEWEGMPVVFSEVLAAGIPILALDKDYLHQMNEVIRFSNVSEAIERLLYFKSNSRRIPPVIHDPNLEGAKILSFYTKLHDSEQ